MKENKPIFFQPVEPFYIHQYFGENRACISNADNKTVITKEQNAVCPKGFRSLYGNMLGHNGLDLQSDRWQPVYASREGEVIEVSTELERGLGVGIYHDLGTYGKWKTRYWHLISINVELGEVVQTGTLIGFADSTGYSSGDHLHFEVKPQKEKGINLYPDNGYFGAVSPLPLMLPTPAWKVSFIRTILELFSQQLDKLSDFLRYIKL